MNKQEIHVIYGSEYRKMTYEILTRIGLAKILQPDMHVGLKPNLVVA